jgi:hypothetical protein
LALKKFFGKSSPLIKGEKKLFKAFLCKKDFGVQKFRLDTKLEQKIAFFKTQNAIGCEPENFQKNGD